MTNRERKLKIAGALQVEVGRAKRLAQRLAKIAENSAERELVGQIMHEAYALQHSAIQLSTLQYTKNSLTMKTAEASRETQGDAW
jgi:hypothetical protein